MVWLDDYGEGRVRKVGKVRVFYLLGVYDGDG